MNKNDNSNEAVSLLKRISARYHSPKIAKALSAIALTSLITLSGTACDLQTTPPNDFESSTAGNFESGSIGNNQSNTETNNQTNAGVSETPKNPNLAKYSQLLQNVLTSDEYNDLIKIAHNSNSNILKTGEFEPHPYEFLEDEGFDVDSIKRGNDLCYTLSFSTSDDPNSLYMYTRVDCGEYYETYLLKYALTAQEMSDYHLTQTGGGSNMPYYIQSVFMNREIAKTRDPEVVGTSKMTKQAFNSLTEDMFGKYELATKTANIILINPNVETKKFDLILYPENTNTYGLACNSEIINLSCYAIHKPNEGILTGPTSLSEILVLNNETKSATLYFTQDKDFGKVYDINLNEYLN